MHQLRELIRLHHQGLSQHQLAKSLSLSAGAINKYIKRIKDNKLTWPLPDSLTDDHLKALLQPQRCYQSDMRHELDFIQIHQALKRKHVTLQLLWEEDCEKRRPHSGYSYSQFCRRYREWAKRQSPSMRQTHVAGEKIFIDYSGDKVSIINRQTGEVYQAEIFVAVLGASNYTFAEATLSQQLPDWIGSHVRMLEFFGGVPLLLVPDNLRSAVTKSCRYEPVIHRTYQDLATHYDIAILPARPRKPKDKAKCENAVLVVQRWILARLRHQTFYSLDQLNREISKLLVALNQRPFKKLPGCRHSQFLQLDQPALKPLPTEPYEFAEFKLARVNLDYHIEVNQHYYSVPYQLVKEEVEVRLTRATLTLFHRHQVVARHARDHRPYQHTTCAEHMPKAHQHYAGWSPGKFLNQAIKIGPATRDVIQFNLDNKKHPEQAYRICLGILRLAKRFTPVRLEKACAYAKQIASPYRRSLVSILEKGLENTPLDSDPPMTVLPEHTNIRGADYYQSDKHSFVNKIGEKNDY